MALAKWLILIGRIYLLVFITICLICAYYDNTATSKEVADINDVGTVKLNFKNRVANTVKFMNTPPKYEYVGGSKYPLKEDSLELYKMIKDGAHMCDAAPEQCYNISGDENSIVETYNRTMLNTVLYYFEKNTHIKFSSSNTTSIQKKAGCLLVKCENDKYYDLMKSTVIDAQYSLAQKSFKNEHARVINNETSYVTHIVFVIAEKPLLKYKNDTLVKLIDDITNSYYNISKMYENVVYDDTSVCKKDTSVKYTCSDIKPKITTSVVVIGQKTYLLKPPDYVRSTDQYLLKKRFIWETEYTYDPDVTYEPTLVALNKLMRTTNKSIFLETKGYEFDATNSFLNDSKYEYIETEKGTMYPLTPKNGMFMFYVNDVDDYLDRWYTNFKYVENDVFVPETTLPNIEKDKDIVNLDQSGAHYIDTHVVQRKVHEENIPFYDPLTSYLGDPFSVSETMNKYALTALFDTYNYDRNIVSISEPYKMHHENFSGCKADEYQGATFDKYAHFKTGAPFTFANSFNSIYGKFEYSSNDPIDMASLEFLDRLRYNSLNFYGLSDSLQRYAFNMYRTSIFNINHYYQNALKTESCVNCDGTDNTPLNTLYSEKNYNLVLPVITAHTMRFLELPVKYQQDEELKKSLELEVKNSKIVPTYSSIMKSTCDKYQYYPYDPLGEILNDLSILDDVFPLDLNKITVRNDIFAPSLLLYKREYATYHKHVHAGITAETSNLLYQNAANIFSVNCLNLNLDHVLKNSGNVNNLAKTKKFLPFKILHEHMLNTPSLMKPPIDLPGPKYFQIDMEFNAFLPSQKENKVVPGIQITPKTNFNVAKCPSNNNKTCDYPESCKGVGMNSINKGFFINAYLLPRTNLDFYNKFIALAIDNIISFETQITCYSSLGNNFEVELRLDSVKKKIHTAYNIIGNNATKEYYPNIYSEIENEKSGETNDNYAHKSVAYIDPLVPIHYLGEITNYFYNPASKTTYPYTNATNVYAVYDAEFDKIFSDDEITNYLNSNAVGYSSSDVKKIVNGFIKSHYKPDENTGGETFTYENIVCSIKQDFLNPLTTYLTESDLFKIISPFECCKAYEIEDYDSNDNYLPPEPDNDYIDFNNSVSYDFEDTDEDNIYSELYLNDNLIEELETAPSLNYITIDFTNIYAKVVGGINKNLRSDNDSIWVVPEVIDGLKILSYVILGIQTVTYMALATYFIYKNKRKIMEKLRKMMYNKKTKDTRIYEDFNPNSKLVVGEDDIDGPLLIQNPLYTDQL